MGYKKVIKIATVILIFIGAIFVNYFQNIKEKGNVSIAKQTLYEVTETDRNEIEFELSPNDNYLNKNNKQYYVFKVLKENGKDCDINYLVKKEGFKVYVCDKRGFVTPYEYYVNKDSVVGTYFEELKNMDYNDIPPATKEYFEREGGIAFAEKIEEIIELTDVDMLDEWGGIVTYIDLIINGVNPESLNKINTY